MHVPVAGAHRGNAAVAEFLKQLGTHPSFTQFEPREFIAQGDRVVTIGSYAGTTSAKKQFKSDWTMVLTVKNAKIVLLCAFCDRAASSAGR